MNFDEEFQRAKALQMEYVFAYGYLRSAVDTALILLRHDNDEDEHRRAYHRLKDAIAELDKRLGKPWESA